MTIQAVGVIGAGQMGSGIAEVLAVAGFDVTVTDIGRDRLDASVAKIEANLSKRVHREQLTIPERDASLARLRCSTVLADLSGCDLVIEAATEDEVVKQRILKDVHSCLRPDAVLTSNTSSLSITRLGGRSGRPERFMGLHFMNPVPIMKLVELVRGVATSDETFEAVRSVVDRLGKTAVTASDYPAFIVNRMLIPMINEAAFLLYESVGSVTDIDRSMKLGANHPMGPLELGDLIGLDTCLSIMRVLYEGMADPKYRPCPLLINYVEAGWVGRKAGRGFYDYSGPSPIPAR